MDKFLMNPQKQTITSLELLEQINFFRWKEGENPTTHKDLLVIIETEFTGINRKRDEIRKCPGALSQIRELLEANGVIVSEYESPNNKRKYPMYILTLNQARQVLARESRIVRAGIFEYIDKLENNIRYLETERLGILERENKLLLRENDLLTRENEFLKSQENILQAPTDPQPKKVKRAIATKRGLIFMITRLEPGFTDDETGYNELYQAFEKKYNINLTEEMLKVGRTRKTHFIEKDLKMIDELLQIAIETFPTGYKRAKEKYKEDIKKLKI